jgi:hypothetical protein
MMRIGGLVWMLAGCHHGGGDDPIVVVFTVDTLGLAMAHDRDWCGDLQGITADYGLDVACLDGGVSPSSWTGEAHTRLLWPQHLVGDRRALQTPECGTRSVLAELKHAIGGRYVWGSDNSVLAARGEDGCGLTTGFSQDVDTFEQTSTELSGLADVPEADRPAHAAIDAFEGEVRKGGPVELFLNAIEPGGHEPRCWFDPESDACSELWDVAVTHGLAQDGDDRRAAWLDGPFLQQLLKVISVDQAAQEDRWRPLLWQTTREASDAFRATMFDDRLRRVLDAAQAADRLGDVQLVVLGDHGENPCVARGFDPTLNCGHNGITTEFTGYVPVFVSPASLASTWAAAGLVGDATHPWSTVNLSFGLLAAHGVDVPADWGAVEPVGTATSWTCHAGEDTSAYSGIHVDGDVSIRCADGACAASTFAIPGDETYKPDLIEPIPESVAEFGGTPDWFAGACGQAP